MLSKLITLVGIPVLDWAFKKLAEFIGKWIRKRKKIDDAKEENAKVREAIEEAKTDEEKETALRARLRRF